jgi:hypothetical protein
VKPHRLRLAAASTLGLALAACAACQPVLDETDKFRAVFNRMDMAGLEGTVHFPHLRIASYPLQVLTGPGQHDHVCGNLAFEGWTCSVWTDRRIIPRPQTTTHMLSTCVRFNASGQEYARYGGLHIIKCRTGSRGLTAR